MGLTTKPLNRTGRAVQVTEYPTGEILKRSQVQAMIVAEVKQLITDTNAPVFKELVEGKTIDALEER